MVQAICGHFEGHTAIQLSDVSFSTSNSEIAISVMAMDDKPLKQSEKIFVQIGNKCRPTDWKTEAITIKNKDGTTEDGFRVLNYGKRPWQVRSALGSISIANTGLSKASVLDMNGMVKATVNLKAENGSIKVDLPKDAMYLVITK